MLVAGRTGTARFVVVATFTRAGSACNHSRARQPLAGRDLERRLTADAATARQRAVVDKRPKPAVADGPSTHLCMTSCALTAPDDVHPTAGPTDPDR